MNTVTDHDMRDEVLATLDDPADYNVTHIVDEIRRTYGTVKIEKIDHDAYWQIVERHALEWVDQPTTPCT